MLYLISHTRLRAHRAPGIPCALFRGQVTGDRQDSRKNMRRECGGVSQMTVSESVGWAKAPLRFAHPTTTTVFGRKWSGRHRLKLRLGQSFNPDASVEDIRSQINVSWAADS